mmetsp:Transcript_26594/g.47773  ORF Transcript_26594/g.47773 Transcript_26594/m.47773 type:complete len:850 (+) Transcript_26594:141-2690(+)
MGIPFFMTVKEFQARIVEDEFRINYERYSESGNEVEVIEFLTYLLLLCTGKFEMKLQLLYKLYQFEDETHMTPDEFFVCMDKTLRTICSLGEVQLPFIEKDSLEDFKDEVCSEEGLKVHEFVGIITAECEKFSLVFQETSNFMRTVSTFVVDNPFPVLQYLQPNELFLGKYEIIEEPQLIEEISSYYKRQYKHALLYVKPMLGTGKLCFELIYLNGVQGDDSFRQNFFREIVLKNKLTKQQVTEFGELPGGILYKSIDELEATQMTLKEYLDSRLEQGVLLENNKVMPCMTETEVIELGLRLLDQLDTLHNMHVIHSNINPSSVYLIEGNIEKLRFMDLELAIWDPEVILGVNSSYFSQVPDDMYDTAFRLEDFISPEHKDLAHEFSTTGSIPADTIDEQCDLYSIGAIMFLALTGKPPTNFSEELRDKPELLEERDLVHEWKCPEAFANLVMTNGMASLLIQLLSPFNEVRHKSITEVRTALNSLMNQLKFIPDKLLKALGHLPKGTSSSWNEPELDLRSDDLNDFALEYLYKYILDSSIPALYLYGGKIELAALKANAITTLELSNKGLQAEDIKLLSMYLEVNVSVTEMDLSKNPILHRHESLLQEEEQQLNKDQEIETTELGIKFLIDSLNSNLQLEKLSLAGVSMGPKLIEVLCEPLLKCINLTHLDLAGCGIGPEGARHVCRTIEEFVHIIYLNLSSNDIADDGAVHVAKLIEKNHHIIEIDLFRNSIGTQGVEAIGNALTTNFIIQKLSIGNNLVDPREMDLILQSVMFNTQYTKLKVSNERFGDFGYELMAESIKRWTESSKFVLEKLKARLKQCEDETDNKLAELLLDERGEIRLELAKR